MTKLLLKSGASILIKDKQGKTPGSLAANKGYLEIVNLLHPFFQFKNTLPYFPQFLNSQF